MAFTVTLMNLEIIILSKVIRKTKQIPYDITYMWNLKYDTNEITYKTDSQRQQTCGCQEGGLVAEWIGSLGVADVKYYILNG